MNNAEKIFLYIIFFFIIVGIVIAVNDHIASYNSVNQGYSELTLKNAKVKGELKECHRYNPFQTAISKIGKRLYNEDYDCLDHAKDLQQELRNLNIESSIFINKDRNHTIVGVWIESTNGQFISIDNDFEILEVRNSKMQTVCHK